MKRILEKIYVKVNSDFDSTGYMMPRTITWADGRTFKIDEVKDFIRGNISAFTGNSGIGKSSILNKIDPRFGIAIGDISKRIENGELVTDGVYALVRHPIYSAWLQISIAIILFSQNIYLFILPIIFWIILSIALARTEEKWLTDKFGNDYVLYAQTTNRFVPFSRLR